MNAPFHTDGYQFPPFRRDRNKHDGEKMVFIQNGIISKIIEFLEGKGSETICIEVTISKKKWCITFAYRPSQNDNKVTFLNELNLCLNYSGLSLSRLLSISNFSLFRTKNSVPWTFMDSVSYFYLFISNFSISNFSLFRTKILVPFNYFSLYLELFLFTQQTERKCSIFENSNVIKTCEIQNSIATKIL